ncbi:MAG TPA: TCR/Tet family MFS transporter [Candidatus Binataceae bacterium]|nr:TCR/Tet family MFS transporter [Candidatus Binataceae bacterium]
MPENNAGETSGDSINGRRPRRAALVFIFITVVLDMVALGMIVPVLPMLVEQFEGGNPARAAEIYGIFGTAWALMQFLASPILGSLSDRFGRRAVVLISCFGLGVDYVVMATAPSVRWLFIGRIVSGICSATISTAYAYIADFAPPDKRASGYGMLSAAFGLGFVLGPALGGWLGAISPRLPFLVAAAFSLTNAMYGLIVLPESLPPERRTDRFVWHTANPLGSIGLLRANAELLGLAAVAFIGFVAHEALPTVFVLYAAYRFHWGSSTMGLALAGVGICSIVVGAGMVQPMVARLGERRVMLIGLLFGIAGFALCGLASTDLWFALAIPLNGLWGLYGPPMQSLMTQCVGESEQGQLQGAIGSIRGIAFMIGPIVFTTVFAAFIEKGMFASLKLPGAPFVLGSALLAISTLLAWRATQGPTRAAHTAA